MINQAPLIKDWLFRQVHTRNLVYNTCWEDPRCDRELLQLDKDSQIVMVTSAGCNALDYLLDGPKAIHTIDVNPRQNALMELKKATFKSGDYRDLFKLFGEGFHPSADYLYTAKLRPYLPDFAQSYWDKNLSYFNGRGFRKSFYFHGTSGTFAWLAQQYFKARKPLYQQVQALFQARDLDEQKAIYELLEPKLINKLLQWMVNRHLSMCLLGVPRSQQELFVKEYSLGASGFILACLRHICSHIPMSDNYFYHLYFYGSYSKDCCPSYLVESNFQQLRQNIAKVQTHTQTISAFLKENPGVYSHYVLLDHQDWLAENNRAALEEEWALILANSRPGTKILLRSAATEIDFFPKFVLDRLYFEQEQTKKTHAQDRVGTYASVYLGIVK